MIVCTYQSQAVLSVLRRGNVYRAHRNLRFDAAYSELVQLLGLHCDCPIFGFLKGRKRCTNGKVNSSLLLTLQVPDDKVWLTEYGVWADFLYCVQQYTRPASRRRLMPNEEFTQRRYDQLRNNLKNQRAPEGYQVPQAVLEEIRPEWLLSVKPGRENPMLAWLYEHIVR